MRTTLDLDDTLLRKAKERARTTNRTLTNVIEESLRSSLAGVPAQADATPYRLHLTTVGGTILPGVDVSDRDALYDRMEGRS